MGSNLVLVQACHNIRQVVWVPVQITRINTISVVASYLYLHPNKCQPSPPIAVTNDGPPTPLCHTPLLSPSVAATSNSMRDRRVIVT